MSIVSSAHPRLHHEGSTDKWHRYTIYHAVVAIVKGHYRGQSGDGELDARKTLTVALKQLTTLEVR